MKTGRPIRDFTGQRFGSYVVLRRGPDRYPRIKNGYHHFTTTWVCRCDCGREKIRTSQDVKRSDRCLICHNKAKMLDATEACTRVLLNGYRQSAKIRDFAWLLSDQEFARMILLPCHYCGKRPDEDPITAVQPVQEMRQKGENRKLMYNGIDRVDNEIGYETSNVVTCCKFCNKAKHRMNVAEFLLWLNRIRGHRA
jgi:hypothetical protein